MTHTWCSPDTTVVKPNWPSSSHVLLQQQSTHAGRAPPLYRREAASEHRTNRHHRGEEVMEGWRRGSVLALLGVACDV